MILSPFVVNGETWKVERVAPGDPRLIDRTGEPRLATADPGSLTVAISNRVFPPLLDKVILHEVAHAVSMSHGSLDQMRKAVPEDYWVSVEEWNAWFVENHAIEAIELASEVLGRPVCVEGLCARRL